MSLVSPRSGAAEEHAEKPRPDVTGNWLGTLEVGAIKLRVALTVSRSVEGKLAATFFSIDQGNVPLSVDALNDAEGELSFDSRHLRLVERLKPRFLRGIRPLTFTIAAPGISIHRRSRLE